MRQPEFGEERWRPRLCLGWSWTMLLLVINLMVFVLMEITKAYNPDGFVKIIQYFALSNEGLFHGYVWQLLSFQFLHLTGWHFVGNMIALFFLGRGVEAMLGGRRFMVLYLTSGLIGGIVQSLLGLAIPTVFGVPVVGASAGVFGLLAAFAALQPETEFLVFFILPVKIKYLALAGAIVALFYTLVPAAPGIAHAAHLGGMAMGWFYVKKILKNPAFLGVEPAERYFQPKPAKSAEKSGDDFHDGDVDAILDKISARGINSLTSRERSILEAARKKMARR